MQLVGSSRRLRLRGVRRVTAQLGMGSEGRKVVRVCERVKKGRQGRKEEAEKKKVVVHNTQCTRARACQRALAHSLFPLPRTRFFQSTRTRSSSAKSRWSSASQCTRGGIRADLPSQDARAADRVGLRAAGTGGRVVKAVCPTGLGRRCASLRGAEACRYWCRLPWLTWWMLETRVYEFVCAHSRSAHAHRLVGSSLLCRRVGEDVNRVLITELKCPDG
jgi:hypothetical protein